MRIALTGHRPERLGFNSDEEHSDWENIRLWMADKIEDIVVLSNSDAPATVYCGMASGSDIAFGLVVSHMKDCGCNVRLCCVLPCKNYNSSHQYFELIKSHAYEWIELANGFYKGCDNARDQYMVDNCNFLLAAWDRNESGGVWSTIKKANKAGKNIIYCPIENLKRQ